MILQGLYVQAVDNYITQAISITGVETMQKRKLGKSNLEFRQLALAAWA
jgi:hypothetical protein